MNNNEFNNNSSKITLNKSNGNLQPTIQKPVRKKIKKKKKDIINNSGKGNLPIINLVSKKFNWGAFYFTFFWGLFNKSYKTLWILALCVMFPLIYVNVYFSIPYLIGLLALPIWFGIKGNTWAWQGKRYNSIEHFHSVQKKWAIAAAVCMILSSLSFIFFVFFNLLTLINNPDLINKVISASNTYMF